MIAESILSFIGAGVPPATPSWGNIMAEGRALWQVKFYIISSRRSSCRSPCSP